MSPVLIVGGGISGLSTAYYLNRAGVPFVLIEKANHLGGVIRTETVNNCLIEGGPDSFLTQKPWAFDLIRDLGIENQVMGSNDDERETFIWKRRRMIPLPEGLQFLVPTKLAPMIGTPLVGWGTKIRMGLEYFRKPGPPPAADRSVAQFVREHYGQETVDYIAEPLLAGVYGGDCEKLSIGSVLPRFLELESRYGSLTRATLDAMARASAANDGKPKAPLFSTLRNGLGYLIEKILENIAENLQGIRGTVRTLEATPAGFRLKVDEEWVESGDVVLACEAHAAAAIATAAFPALAAGLAAIPYSSSMTVALGFDLRDIRAIPTGFGFLVPKVERERLVACTFVGNKFRHRESENVLLLRCFLGGASDEAILSESDAAVTKIVLAELRGKVHIDVPPLFVRIHRWPRSMAQYTLGHQERVRNIDAALAQAPGLYVAGNAYTGIGIPDCVRMGKAAAQAIAKRRQAAG